MRSRKPASERYAELQAALKAVDTHFPPGPEHDNRRRWWRRIRREQWREKCEKRVDLLLLKMRRRKRRNESRRLMRDLRAHRRGLLAVIPPENEGTFTQPTP